MFIDIVHRCINYGGLLWNSKARSVSLTFLFIYIQVVDDLVPHTTHAGLLGFFVCLDTALSLIGNQRCADRVV